MALVNGKCTMDDWMIMVDALNYARSADAKMRLTPPVGSKWATTVHKEHMEALVPKLMPEFQPTHVFNGKDSLNGEDDTHPFVGVPVMVCKPIHGCKAGMTALVVAYMPTIKAAVDGGRFNHEMSGDKHIEFFKEQDWHVGDYVLLETRLEDDLDPITNQPPHLNHEMLMQYREEFKNIIETYLQLCVALGYPPSKREPNRATPATNERIREFWGIMDHCVRVLDDIWDVGMPTATDVETAGSYLARMLKNGK